MLKIRAEQMERFRDQARLRFESEVEQSLRAHFPEECVELGGDDLTAVVRATIARAGEHGLELEHDVRRYCNLAFALGLDFDQELPWAAEVLADAELAPAERVDGLCLLAEDELDVEDELPVEVEVRA